MMEVKYDSKINALNITFQKEDYEERIEVADGIVINYSTDKKIMSIEILDVTEKNTVGIDGEYREEKACHLNS